ncbi:torulene oxygenase [Niveomyces insectorum RCEF 264]|uniref:Torulene oxygenase n=1 Tax=Niveomyces insectorum RCEF 264 TaxID=1081102 RepID=A0A162K549_9HYPO|nr:torulene oxygenase [Niveomyces insectorum RCEF 264]
MAYNTNGTAGKADAQPGQRTAADEEVDRKELLANWASPAFDDWPNEGGFDGLEEERGPVAIPVVGTIPAWAAGNLYRTGPGQCKVENTPTGTYQISHWFDGLAHTHRFEIVAEPAEPATASGDNDPPVVKVYYSSRRQAENRARYLQAHGGAKLFGFGQRSDPCVGLLGKFMTVFKAAAGVHRRMPEDVDNVNVVLSADVPGFTVDRSMSTSSSTSTATATTTTKTTTTAGHRVPSNLWVTTDANILRKVDPATLEPLGVARQTCVHPDLRGPLSAAHAQRDPQTGDWYNFNLEMSTVATYRIFRVSAATGQADILATVRCGARIHPAYIHSFFLTPNYVVLRIPCTHFTRAGLTMLWHGNVVEGIAPFDPAKQATRWLVVDRRPGGSGGVVAEFTSPAGFFFHSVNAYEEATSSEGVTDILCDVVEFPNFDIVRGFYYDVLLNRDGAGAAFYRDQARTQGVLPSLARYRLRLPAKTSTSPAKSSTTTATAAAVRLWSIPAPHTGELPTINPAYATRRHRFVYSMSNRGRSTLSDGLVKTDTQTRAALLWRAPEAHTPGEAIFVPRPGPGLAEDDGVLLSVVLDGRAGTSYVLCLDARTMQETGRATMTFAVGFGFHGLHAPAVPLPETVDTDSGK